MSPKEKAIKLVERFENLQSNKMSDYSKIEYPTAKECALIAVEEILRSHHNLYGLNNKEVKFYLEVQQEIEEL
jgi:hypothetical protein